jgi:ferredoxin
MSRSVSQSQTLNQHALSVWCLMRNEKPKVDQNLCTGDQVCIAIAPDVFEINEEGLAYVADPEGADEDTIQRAIDQCPSQAMHACIFCLDSHY